MVTDENIIVPRTDLADRKSGHILLNIILGIIIGAALVGFLVVPSFLRSSNRDLNNQITAYTSEISRLNLEVETLKESGNQNATEEEKDQQSTKEERDSVRLLLAAQEAFSKADNQTASQDLIRVDRSVLNSSEQSLYDTLSSSLADEIKNSGASAAGSSDTAGNTSANGSTEGFGVVTSSKDDGISAFRNGNYDEAIALLEQARASGEGDYDVLNYLSRAYAQNGDQASAARIRAELEQKFPNGASSGTGSLSSAGGN